VLGRARDLKLLAALVVLCGLIWGFLELAEEVRQGSEFSFDARILLALRADPAGKDPIGPPWLEDAMLNLSALGSGWVAIFVAVLVVGFTFLVHKPRMGILIAACAIGAGGLTSALKAVFARARPDVVVPMTTLTGYGFPSGHAMISSALYATLAALIARSVDRWRVRSYVIAAGTLITLLVGFTRIYLGVHYPSDVLAGWTSGLAWALLCGLAARALQRRGIVEQGPQP
jgi:undecaprenyl-diphosphatase